jgi:propanol-preferring alcohol dehydrogenase
MCGGLTAWAALKKARTQPGEWIVISGAGGGIGHLACQMASKAMGLRVLGIDSKSKEELARDCGAEQYLCIEDFSQNNSGELAIIDAVKTCTVGLGAAAVLVCNGSDSSYAQSLGFLRFNGTMVVVGCQEGPARPIATATPNMILFNQLHITGIAVGNRNDAIEVLDLAARGIIRARVNVELAEDLEAIFARMHNKQSFGKTVVKIF